MLAEVPAEKPNIREVILTDEIVEQFATAAPLHDIGKVGIQVTASSASWGTTPEEMGTDERAHDPGGTRCWNPRRRNFTTIHGHCRRVIARATMKINGTGTGYPEGPKENRAIHRSPPHGCADVYDALVSNAAYIGSHAALKAVDILSGCGTHFDPDVIDAFLNR